MERLGTDLEGAQLRGVVEARGHVQLLELLEGIPGELEGPEFDALLGQGVQGVADKGVKEKVSICLKLHRVVLCVYMEADC